MFVVVALTIWAPVSDSTTWTLVPVTVSPDVGLTIATTAGEVGLLPEPTGADGAALVGGALAVGPPHAATIAATSMAARDREANLVIAASPLDRRSRCAPSGRRRRGIGRYIVITDLLIAVRNPA
jgi:hypothetical protein